jgi:dipeptidyl aminopeptidase/acylaminoacyl peptidase
MFLKAVCLVLLAVGTTGAQKVPSAISMDTAPDLNPGASSVKMTVPSHGEMLLGIFYEAAGPGKHPTVVLLHGFPGYEQNLDLAQAMRRAGWNVLAMHYRGSWGVGGDFSLAHASEDADAMVAFAHSPESARKYHIDPDRIVVVGHSMGGYMAAWAAAHESAVLGAVMIGMWDITEPVRGAAGSRDELMARAEKDDGTEPADFLPLHGYSRAELATEIVDHRAALDLDNLAGKIAPRPVLLLTADDGSEAGSERFMRALQAAGDKKVELLHAATDHLWAGKRIYLEALLLNWLEARFEEQMPELTKRGPGQPS